MAATFTPARTRRLALGSRAPNLGDDINYQIRQLAQFVRDVVPNTTVHMIPDDPESGPCEDPAASWVRAHGPRAWRDC
jgi:hypothetical protein